MFRTNLIQISYQCHPTRRTSGLCRTPLFPYTGITMDRRALLQRWLHPDSAGRAAGADEELTLADLHANERAKVLDLCCGKLATSRLVSLGFIPGAEVDMAQNYGRGPIIVTVRGGQVALGRGEASNIRVERLPR
jgi:ferrous iron transport protein A